MLPTDKIIFKAGVQSSGDPFEFVMSTETPDRSGDVVVQDWDLKNFRKNPIALFAHKHSAPIGQWRSVRKSNGQLVGRLELAEKGTSGRIDELRSLVEQRILRAVSVGFLPDYDKSGPIDEKDPYGAWRLQGNELLECSLVTVPMNQEALSTAKGIGSLATKILATEKGCSDRMRGLLPAYMQMGSESRDSDIPDSDNSTSKGKPAMKTLSQKIKELQELQVSTQDGLTELIQNSLGDDATPEEVQAYDLQVDELTAQVEKQAADLERLLAAEKALARKAAQSDPASDPTKPAARITVRKERKKGHVGLGVIACKVIAHVTRQLPADVARVAFKDDPEVESVIRAPSDLGTMTDATNAAPLVRETWGEFLELLRDQSVYPGLPGMRLEMGRNGVVNLPRQAGRGSLAGGFVAEGAPIPVREPNIENVDLGPKKMAVISAFTKELATHSVPAVQTMIQNQMVGDTAEVIDTLYLDANARTAVRPAGLQDPTETGAPNIVAASGATVAAINADTEAMIQRLLASRTGNNAVWIVNPAHLITLRNIQDAASGVFVYRDEIAGGTFMGYPIVSSQNVTPNLLTLQGDGAVAYGEDFTPTFEVSDTATIVMDDTAPDHIVDGGLATTQPVRSMFQVDGIAVKYRLGLDWRIIRVGGVQVLTGFLP